MLNLLCILIAASNGFVDFLEKEISIGIMTFKVWMLIVVGVALVLFIVLAIIFLTVVSKENKLKALEQGANQEKDASEDEPQVATTAETVVKEQPKQEDNANAEQEQEVVANEEQPAEQQDVEQVAAQDEQAQSTEETASDEATSEEQVAAEESETEQEAEQQEQQSVEEAVEEQSEATEESATSEEQESQEETASDDATSEEQVATEESESVAEEGEAEQETEQEVAVEESANEQEVAAEEQVAEESANEQEVAAEEQVAEESANEQEVAAEESEAAAEESEAVAEESEAAAEESEVAAEEVASDDATDEQQSEEQETVESEQNAEQQATEETENVTTEVVTKGAIGKLNYYLEESGYYFSLNANNGQELFVSYSYTTLDGAMKGFETFANAVKDGKFIVSEDKNGRFRYILNKKYQGPNYKTKTACENSINSVKKFAQSYKINVIEPTEEDKALYQEYLENLKKARDIDMEAIAKEEAATPKSGSFEIEESVEGYRFYLYANNKQILYCSNLYANPQSARNGIDAFKKAVYGGVVIIEKDKFNNYRYILRNSTAVTYAGESFKAESSARSQFESVKRFVKSATIIPYKKKVEGEEDAE